MAANYTSIAESSATKMREGEPLSAEGGAALLWLIVLLTG